MTDNRVHVISLNSRQQLALKLMLFNLYVNFSKKLMADLVDSPSNSTLAIKVGLMQDAFIKYNKLSELLVVPTNEPPRNKMLKLHTTYMKYIVFAVKGFDSAQCSLRESEIALIEREFDDMAELVEDSAQFTYTGEEIDKWLGRKR
jgi:hypothetical protein